MTVTIEREDLEILLRMCKLIVAHNLDQQAAVVRLRAAIQQPAAPDLSPSVAVGAVLSPLSKTETVVNNPNGSTTTIVKLADDIRANMTESHEQPDIRTQLLAFVPPISEWPWWAQYIAADSDDGYFWLWQFKPDYRDGIWDCYAGASEQTEHCLPFPEFEKVCDQSLFSLTEVLEGRGW